jgi:DNA invertase Pin-like site-specific DNA recombinase
MRIRAADAGLITARNSERNMPSNKLDEAKIRQIQRLLDQHVKKAQIAKRTGVSRPTVYEIAKTRA